MLGNEAAFSGKGHLNPEAEEIRQLKREVELLKMEREILKKAMAIFSKDPSQMMLIAMLLPTVSKARTRKSQNGADKGD